MKKNLNMEEFLIARDKAYSNINDLIQFYGISGLSLEWFSDSLSSVNYSGYNFKCFFSKRFLSGGSDKTIFKLYDEEPKNQRSNLRTKLVIEKFVYDYFTNFKEELFNKEFISSFEKRKIELEYFEEIAEKQLEYIYKKNIFCLSDPSTNLEGCKVCDGKLLNPSNFDWNSFFAFNKKTRSIVSDFLYNELENWKVDMILDFIESRKITNDFKLCLSERFIIYLAFIHIVPKSSKLYKKRYDEFKLLREVEKL